MDCRFVERGGKHAVEWSWGGADEMDPCAGGGWAVLEAPGRLVGRFLLHQGDDSGFVAERDTKTTRKVRIPEGRPVGPRLTSSKREFLLDALVYIDEDVKDKLRAVPPGESEVMLDLDELDSLAGSVAAMANHTEDMFEEQ
jgi:hypothetical protein